MSSTDGADLVRSDRTSMYIKGQRGGTPITFTLTAHKLHRGFPGAQLPCCEMLLDAGADKATHGRRVLEEYVKTGEVDIARRLLVNHPRLAGSQARSI